MKKVLSAFLLALALVAPRLSQAAITWNVTPSAAVVCNPYTVAPRACWFNVTALTSSVISTANKYIHIECYWNFDDASAGSSLYGNPSLTNLNSGKGQIVAHLYETNGTYTPTVKCDDGDEVKEMTVATITVTTADAQWPTTNTVCFYNSTVGTGCPSGATQHSTSSFSDAIGFAISGDANAPYHRILFKGGDTFTFAGAGTSFSTTGPGLISSYGSGKAHINMSSAGSAALEFGADSWRIGNLDFNGMIGTTGGQGIHVVHTNYVTIFGLTSLYLGSGTIDFQGGSPNGSDHFMMFNNHISELTYNGGSSAYGIFGGNTKGGQYLAMIANLAETGTSVGSSNFNANIVRIQPTCRWCYIAQNTISNSDISYSELKLDAQDNTADGTSIYVNIYANKFPGSATTAVSPQGPGYDEYLEQITVDSNMFGGTVGYSCCGTLNISARNVVARNNIFHGPSSDVGFNGIQVAHYGAVATPIPDNVWLVNNSFYSAVVPGDSHYIHSIQLCNMLSDPSYRDLGTVHAYNNVSYYPNAGTNGATFDDDWCTTSETLDFKYNTNMDACGTNCVGSTNQELVDPNWTNGGGSYLLPTDFTPDVGSYLIAAGTSDAQIRTDMFGNCWDGITPDLGAINHDATGPCSASGGGPVIHPGLHHHRHNGELPIPYRLAGRQ